MSKYLDYHKVYARKQALNHDRVMLAGMYLILGGLVLIRLFHWA